MSAFEAARARLAQRGDSALAVASKAVVCDDFSRVYDDGARHRSDLEEQGTSPWESDINPLTYATDAVPGAAMLGASCCGCVGVRVCV